MDRPAKHPGVRAREIDELEDAQGPSRTVGEAEGLQAAIVDPDEFSGFDVPHVRGADDVERARLGGDHESVRQSSDRERSHTVGIARREQAALVHQDEAEGAAERGEHLHGRGLEPITEPAREERGDEIGVGRRAAGSPSQLGQLGRVHEIPVVTERERAGAIGLEGRLRVLPGGRSGGRVARVADAEVALERGQRGLVEHLGDQAELLVHGEVGTVGNRDPRGFLAAMLLSEEAEVGEPGDILSRGPDPEEATLLLWTFRSHLEPDGNTGLRRDLGSCEPAGPEA